MPAQLFDSDDKIYREWMDQHCDGVVANTGRSIDSQIFVIHIALCPHISKYGPGQTCGCFTTSGRVKVCSMDSRDLEEWQAQHRPLATQIKDCRDCKPRE